MIEDGGAGSPQQLSGSFPGPEKKQGLHDLMCRSRDAVNRVRYNFLEVQGMLPFGMYIKG